MSGMKTEEFLDFVTERVRKEIENPFDDFSKVLKEKPWRVERWIMASLDNWTMFAIAESKHIFITYYTGELAKEILEHFKKVFLEQESA